MTNPNWVKELQRKRHREYSQGGQDGLIAFVFDNIGVTNRRCVEFGFNSDTITGGTGANTARLVQDEGWNQLYFDALRENAQIRLYKRKLLPGNIASVFAEFEVPREIDYVSIDVDGIDLWLFRAMLQAGYRPRLVSVEYNSHFPLSVSATVKPDTGSKLWTGGPVYGASLLALNRVASEFGYSLVCVEVPFDLFFVRNDLLTEVELLPVDFFSQSVRVFHHCRHSSEFTDFSDFVEYPSLFPVSFSWGWQ